MEAADVAVTRRGDVGTKDVRHAREEVARLARFAGGPIRFARVKLTAASDPARERPAIAEAQVEVGGDLVRAQVGARDMHAAIDALTGRLRAQLEERKDRRLAHRKRGPEAREPGEWQHGDWRPPRPTFFPRPAAEREVVRHKSYEPRPITPAQADEAMRRLDHDFHLFVDALTGEDSVVVRSDEGAVRWAVSGPPPVPLLGETEAAERLGAAGLPFLFYRDRASGRGAVLYRRYDGHYGVVALAAGAPTAVPPQASEADGR